MLENIISESSNMTFTTLICLGTALVLGTN